VVYVLADDPRRPPLHYCEAIASSVNMVVQHAVYLRVTVLARTTPASRLRLSSTCHQGSSSRR
jgi:hypothetical protein